MKKIIFDDIWNEIWEQRFPLKKGDGLSFVLIIRVFWEKMTKVALLSYWTEPEKPFSLPLKISTPKNEAACFENYSEAILWGIERGPEILKEMETKNE